MKLLNLIVYGQVKLHQTKILLKIFQDFSLVALIQSDEVQMT